MLTTYTRAKSCSQQKYTQITIYTFILAVELNIGESVNHTPGAAKAISYEVILSPRVQNARQPQLTPKKEGILTRQDIDEKIAAAEKRRKVRTKLD